MKAVIAPEPADSNFSIMTKHHQQHNHNVALPAHGLSPRYKRAEMQNIQNARVYATGFARRARNRAAQIRLSFIETQQPHQPPPMARILRGGRGGEVRLKLYLSLLWFAAKPPHDVTIPAYNWAGLLGLPDHESNGARRISDALNWLDRHHFVTLNRQPGQVSKVTLLREDGSGSPYEIPGKVGASASRITGVPFPTRKNRKREYFYVKIRSEFWTNGWIAFLSGRAIAMLLALLNELHRNKRRPTEVWFTPADALERFGLSEESRSAGLQELKDAGLLTIRRASVSKPLEFRRMRNVYKVDLDILESEPANPPP